MFVTRRDVLFGLGGGIAGMTLTPAPWKLLDDVSIWTQHRRALEVPPHGEVTFRPAACTLCPGGCALKARLVSGRPVAVVGERAHPLGGGACAFGLTVHHLALHPLRLAAPARRAAGSGSLEPIRLDAAVLAVAAAVTEARRRDEVVLVVDRRPGRVVSRVYREWLAALPRGTYVAPAGEGATLAALEGLLDRPSPLGIDLEGTRTLVSFGAPVLDGWGRPARLLAARRALRVVQADTWRSPTAAVADEWVPIRPGGEGPLALGLAHVLLRERLCDPALLRRLDAGADAASFRRVVAGFPPDRVARIAGVEAGRLETLARSLPRHAPAVAIGGGDAGGGPLPPDDERAIAALDVLLGAVGRGGGIVRRRPVPEAADTEPPLATTDLAEVPAGSVRLLFLDAADSGRALPWPALERTLARGALVVSLSPFRSGLARHAQILVPAPAPLEMYDEVLPSADAKVASYGVSAPILAAPAGATDPVELLRRVAEAAGVPLGPATSIEELLKARVAAIHGCGRGRVFARGDGGYSETQAASAGDLWQRLVEGGGWVDEPSNDEVQARLQPPHPKALLRWARAEARTGDVTLLPLAARGAAGSTPVSPLLTKLYQESDLRPPVGTIAVSPRTGRVHGLADGGRAVVESDAGALEVGVRFDPALPDGRVALAAGPDPAGLHPGAETTAAGALALAVVEPDGTWRTTRVRVREA
jgi:anaerobic selenocysteine-containing dehydrogenase